MLYNFIKLSAYYLQLIKLCVTYGISLKLFNQYWADTDKIDLDAIIKQAKLHILEKKNMNYLQLKWNFDLKMKSLKPL